MDFLVLGNGPSLNLVDWDRVDNSTLRVVGINRSYLEYKNHETLHIQDPVVVLELFDAGYSDDEIACLNIQTTNYFVKRMGIERRRNKLSTFEFDRLRSMIRENILFINNDGAFPVRSPFSAIHAMNTIVRKIRKSDPGLNINFYLIGSELKFSKSNNHFWQQSLITQTRMKGTGGSNKRQLYRQYISFRRLRAYQRAHKFNVISCTPNSRLNTLFKTESLDSVLGRFAKRK